MPSALGFIGGGLLQGVGKGLVLDGKQKREAALKRFEQEGADKRMAGKEKFERLMADLDHKRGLELEGVRHKNRRELKTEDRAAQQTNDLELKAAPGALGLPTGYRRTEGGLEFIPGGPADPSQAKGLADAKRDPDGGTTLAQQAANAEIDAARAALDRMGFDKAEIMRRTQKATNTGRENPDYDPGLERLVRAATQRKVGSDPYFNLFHRRYLGPPPEFGQPAGPKALPPGVSAEQPDAFDRLSDFFSGDDDTPAPESAGTRPSRARGGRPGTRGRGGAKAITAMSITELDDLINERGDSLSPAELEAIQARLAELGA